jgi:hypothetical protein
MESKNKFYEDVDYKPDADGMINNMDYGGLDLPSCIQELKDNSDDKKSPENKIYLLSDGSDNNCLQQLIQTDQGPGMTAEEFAYSIILAKKMAHAQGDIGKFGMGLNNATMATGNKIVIATKTIDGSSRGMYLDLSQMRRDNTFKPTLICEGAENFKALIARDLIFDSFMSQPSGVLISITDIKMNIDDIEVESKKLQNILNLAYKTNLYTTKIYTSPTSDPLVVSEVDVFYKSDPSKVEYAAETTLRVYVKSDKKTVESVFEVLTGKRIKGQHQGNRTWYGGKSKPVYLKHKLEYKTTPTGKITYKPTTTEEITLPTGQYYEINIRFICVKEEVYNQEGDDPRFAGVPHKRRGLWFYRNIRCVGKCIELGQSLNDECNRQRMEITYPPDLDYPMGMRIQKQMGTITSTSISDALITIWEQQNKEIIRQKQKERKEKKTQQVVEESNDDEDEYEQLAELYDSDESSEDDEPPKIIKAKKPIVAPPPKQEISPFEENDEQNHTNIIVENEEEEEEEDEEEQEEAEDVESDHDESPGPVEHVAVNTTSILIIPQSDTSDNTKTNMTVVSGFTRNTPKSEKDVFNKFISIMTNPKLQEKNSCASIVTHPKWTQIYTQLDLFEYELNN